MKCALVVLLQWYMANPISIRTNVSSAVNVSQSVLMMRFRIRSVLVRVRAVLVRSRVTAKDELRSIMICEFPAVSVW